MLLNRIMELANGLNSALRLRRLSSECPLLGGRTLWPICPSSISARPPRAAELPALTLPRPVSWPITRYNKTITNCIEFVLTHFVLALTRPQVCDFLQEDNTTLVWDNEQQVPFAYRDDQWVGFDDERSLRTKVRITSLIN